MGDRGAGQGCQHSIHDEDQQGAGKAGVWLTWERKEFHLCRVIVEASGVRRDVFVWADVAKYHNLGGL